MHVIATIGLESMYAVAIPVKALKFTPAEGTPMADPKDFPRPPKSGDFPPPPSNMAGGPPPGGPGGFGPPGGFPGMGGKKKGQRPKLTGNHVWVNVDGKAAPRPVKIGLSDGVNVQILKGLNVGDSVVVSQETANTATVKKSDASSPFMPGPPGKKNKKR